MIKGLLVFINIIFLSLISFFVGEVVSIDTELPANANPGEAFEVSVKIKKGTLKEFAKFQYQLPAGFTAENIESKGGSFSFASQQVKIIWTALPAEEEFQIKFKVKTFASVNGKFDFTGKFSYVSQGTKYEALSAQKSIVIGAPAVASTPVAEQKTTATTQATEPSTATTTATTPEKTTEKTPTANNTTTVATTTETTTPSPKASANTTALIAPAASTGTEAPQEVTVKRNLSVTQVKSGNTFVVELIISKGDLTGFAKVMESLPVGFTAEEVDAAGGMFSFQENKAKILWMTMPAGKEIKVKYKVSIGANISGKQNIDGFFSYLKESDGSNKKVAFPTSEITVSDQAPATELATKTNTTSENKDLPKTQTTATPTNNTSEKETPTESKTENSVKVIDNSASATVATTTTDTKKEKTAQTTKKAEKKTDLNTNTSNSNQASVAVSTPGITNNNQSLYYSVQICATKKSVDVSYFVKNNNVNEKIYTLMHEGWHKYTVGEFSVYKDARDHRETVKTQNKVIGPFVTAYNKGTRITVQEALMISGQQWVQ